MQVSAVLEIRQEQEGPQTHLGTLDGFNLNCSTVVRCLAVRRTPLPLGSLSVVPLMDAPAEIGMTPTLRVV